MTIGEIIMLIAIGIPVIMAIFIFGILVGFNRTIDMDGWCAGFDDGWEACEKHIEEERTKDDHR